MVLDVLDSSKSGLIPQEELREAVMQVVRDNELEVDEQGLNDLLEAVYLNEEGEEKSEVSRHAIRQALNEIPMVKELSEQVI